MKISRKRIKSSSLLASAMGVGSVGAAIMGIAGAIGGAILGVGVAFWAEAESEKTDHHYQRNSAKKAHA